MTVELIDCMGDDLTIVNAARVSFHKRSEKLTEADEGLIRYLARNSHGTPFEQVVFSFRVRTSIKVAREFQRHRIASFNEESTRYVEMRPEFYLPDLAATRSQVGKPGDYRFEPLAETEAHAARMLMEDAYEEAYYRYKRLLELGVARELASFVLPLGLLTEFVVTMNFRALTNFLSLRTAPSALLEIRVEAAAMEDLVRPRVPIAMKAWIEGGRKPL